MDTLQSGFTYVNSSTYSVWWSKIIAVLFFFRQGTTLLHSRLFLIAHTSISKYYFIHYLSSDPFLLQSSSNSTTTYKYFQGNYVSDGKPTRLRFVLCNRLWGGGKGLFSRKKEREEWPVVLYITISSLVNWDENQRLTNLDYPTMSTLYAQI